MDSSDSGARGPLAGSAEARRIYLEAADTLLERFAADSSLQAIVDLAVPVLADWCYIHLVATPHPRIVAIANADPAAAADARARAATSHALSPNTAVARVLAGGPSELVHVSDETLRAAAVDADHLAVLRQRAFRSAVVAPLLGRDGVLGAVTFAMTDSGRSYQAADLDMLAKLARRAGIALDNARLFAAERAARERVVRMQQLTEELSRTVEQGDVVRVMVESGRRALGAAAGFAWLLAGADQLELVAAEDPADPAPIDERYTRFPLSRALPICEAVRTGKPLMFENVAAMLAAFPDAVPRNAASYHAWAVVPFVAARRALGGISFSFTSERTFSDEDRALLATMTTQAALALERAQLIAAERAAREAAESVTHQFAASEENLRVALVAGRAATWTLDLRTMRSVRDRTYLALTGHH
ncbi:MAG TPA: GAF domain-containing protein, partial [Kofleriaceae bacterium]